MMDTYQNFAPDDLFGALAEHARGRIPPQIARDWFIENGVPPINLVKTWAGYYDVVLHDDVIFLDNGCFEFCRYREGKAQAALTFACWDRDGICDDVCAWQASTGRIATWLGHASMLGEDNLSGPQVGDGLEVHSTPLDWFKANRSGVYVLNMDRSAQMLREAGKLVASSLDQARRLKRALTVPAPEILVPSEVAA